MLKYHQSAHLIKLHPEEILKLKINKINNIKNFLMTETCMSSNRTIKLKPNSNEEKQKKPPKRTRKWGDFHQKKRSTIHNWLRA